MQRGFRPVNWSLVLRQKIIKIIIDLRLVCVTLTYIEVTMSFLKPEHSQYQVSANQTYAFILILAVYFVGGFLCWIF